MAELTDTQKCEIAFNLLKHHLQENAHMRAVFMMLLADAIDRYCTANKVVRLTETGLREFVEHFFTIATGLGVQNVNERPKLIVIEGFGNREGK